MTITIPSVQSIDDALEIVLAHVERLSTEVVGITGARARVLADDVAAPADLWAFPRSAMDGFAVRSEDVVLATVDHPVTLPVVGTVFAGGTPAGAALPGTAIRIATGAPVPEGADAVVPIERTKMRGDAVMISEPFPPGRHIFPAGEDARRGEVILRRGIELRAGHLGLLASLGIDRVVVVRRATVALLTVGDELVEPGQVPRSGQVRDSNSFALAAAVEEAGGIPWRLKIARDEIPEVAGRIRQGLEADALIVCAGMSVGERDVVKQALAEAGVRLMFWRVPMKPGAPAAFGMAGSTPVFGLPGTPGAAMVAFEELVRPALRAMMGYRGHVRPALAGILAERISVKPGRRRYVWARVEVNDGKILVHPLRAQGTATVRSISDANGLVTLEPEIGTLNRGALVRVQMLGALEAPVRPDVPVLGVVGAKGAGKTFLIERLIPELRRRGYQVAVVKHDVHGFEIDHAGTDTARATAAGATVTVITGPGQAVAMYRREGTLSLAEAVDLVRGVDLILVEGYSQHPTHKIEVRRRGIVSDKPKAQGSLVAVVTDSALEDGELTFDDTSILADRIEAVCLAGHRQVT